LGYWVTQGATASRETWRVEGPDQTLDHPFLGTFDDWLFQHLAGIQAASPGYAKIRVAPYFAAGLDNASATVTTPRGQVTSSWKRAGGMLTLNAKLPRGVTTEIVIPFGADRVHVVSGKLKVIAGAAGRTVYDTGSAVVAVQIREHGA